MSRVKVAAISTLAFNAGQAVGAGTTIDATAVSDGMYIAGADLEPESLPANKGADLLVLIVTNTAAADHAITIDKGGTEPDSSFSPWPAFRASLGDLAVTVTHDSTGATPFVIGPLETSRFKQTNGDINIDLASGFTGAITALLLPKAPYVQ